MSSTTDRGRGGGRIVVEDGGTRRPFMRGIMTHALMARGVSFDDAFRVANQVRERLRGRAVVTREELAQSIKELLGELPAREELPGRGFPVDIVVTGEGRELPFSKGVLAQSLLAAAIEPEQAFDVARQLERRLVEGATRRIDRHELRRSAYDTLRAEVGPAAAERYRVWRRFQQPTRPVLVLLGGAAGAGKTTLAQEVAYRLGITRVLSTDAIRQVMRVMLSRELIPLIHHSSFDAHEALASDWRGEDRVVDAFRAQAQVVAVGARAILERAVAEKTNLILDGVSVVPGLIDLELFAKTAHVIFLVIANLDTEPYERRFALRDDGSGARPQHRYIEHLPAILRIQEYLLEMADHHDVPIVLNETFDASVLSIIRHVTESLRERWPRHASDPE